MEIGENYHEILFFRRINKNNQYQCGKRQTSTPITPVQLRVVSTTGGSACETDSVIVGGEVGDGLEVVISIAVLVGVKIAAWVG